MKRIVKTEERNDIIDINNVSTDSIIIVNNSIGNTIGTVVYCGISKEWFVSMRFHGLRSFYTLHEILTCDDYVYYKFYVL